jgi:TatD DNase family protein
VRVRWTDDHCHLPDDPAEAAAQVAEAREVGVERIITVGTELDHSRSAIALARTLDGVWATAGVHPHEAKDGMDGLEELLHEPEVVAVGECGLDYYYDHSPRDVQAEVFAAQIRLSHAHGLPLVIHTRDAWDDTFAVLEAEGIPARTVFHCFSGGVPEAQRALAMGAYLSIAGVVTFPSAGNIREAVGICPLGRLLVETDAPYLAPVPHRGKPNRPGLVRVVGEAVAEVKGLAPEAVAEATWDNAEILFGL